MKKFFSITLLILSSMISYAQTTVINTVLEQELFDQGLITGPTDGFALTSELEQINSFPLTNLPLLTDLTGIEAMNNLQGISIINCGNIPSFDLTNHPQLTNLTISQTQLNNLSGLNSLVNLEELILSGIDLANIDLTLSSNLTELGIVGNNTITNLNISSNSLLEKVSLNNNPLLGPISITNKLNLEDFTAEGSSSFGMLDFTGCNNLKYVRLEDLTGTTEINLSNLPSLDFLDADGNQANKIDIFSNPVLDHLSLGNCPNLSVLNIQNNPLLDELFLNNCPSLLNLDASNLTSLRIFTAPVSGLVNLNLLGCNSLDVLTLSQVPNLVDLDLTNLTGLRTLNIQVSNSLTNLNLTGCTALEQINGQSNNITNLDASDCTSLLALNCASCNIETLDISNSTVLQNLNLFDNKLKDVDLSNNAQLNQIVLAVNELETLKINNRDGSEIPESNFAPSINPDLTCIQVDDPSNWNPNHASSLDAQMSFSTDCRETYVPDDAFETYLINQGLDAGPLDDYVPTANIEVITTVTAPSLGISDLTGIEDFMALTQLNVNDNLLTTVDLTLNANLSLLDISDNSIGGINVASNPALFILNAQDNNLTSLDLDANPVLSQLNVNNNQLSSLDLDQNLNLIRVDANNNSISTFTAPVNSTIQRLEISNNQLTTLDIPNNPSLNALIANNNMLTSFDVNNNAALSMFVARNNQLTTLNFATNSALAILDVSNNLINGVVGFGPNPDLFALNLRNNQITSVDISTNTLLLTATLEHNLLTAINTANNTALSILKVSNNSLSQVNGLDNNSFLTYLDVRSNQLQDINLQNGNNTNTDVLALNSGLTCILVDDPMIGQTGFASFSINGSPSYVANLVDCGTLPAKRAYALEETTTSIYPTRVDQVLFLDLANGDASYVLYNTEGISYSNGTLVEGSNQINLSDAPSGIYIIKVNLSNGDLITQKVIKK